MPTTINDYIKKCQFVASEMLNEQERIVLANETEIVNLNKNQFTDGLGSDNKQLFTPLRSFDGIYKEGYKKQGLYDFYEKGIFIKGMFVIVLPNKTELIIDSSGKGDGEKKLFINSYTNLFGLDNYYENILNYDLIYPELMKFIKRYL